MKRCLLSALSASLSVLPVMAAETPEAHGVMKLRRLKNLRAGPFLRLLTIAFERGIVEL
jgi:hypothetical protein